MLRIDDNTYIDDTLVTCAEYQLFIDEMREQGKYYQPDHWTSYQFPKGEAIEPILGERHSDAVAFCEWLRYREDGEWKFRLPTQKEADIYPMKSLGKSPLGYWLDENYLFAWIETTPKGSRALDLSFDLAHNRARDRVNDRVFILDRALDRALVRSIDRALDLALAHDRALALTRAHDLAHALARVFARTRDLKRASDLNLAINLSIDLALAILDRDLALDRTLDVYMDIFTLQERIAGRSPAFEGIRLVKERIR